MREQVIDRNAGGHQDDIILCQAPRWAWDVIYSVLAAAVMGHATAPQRRSATLLDALEAAKEL